MSATRYRHRRGIRHDATRIGDIPPGRSTRLCRVSGKRKFKTRDKALADARRYAPPEVMYADAYLCQHCRKWHVTTKRPLKAQAA